MRIKHFTVYFIIVTIGILISRHVVNNEMGHIVGEPLQVISSVGPLLILAVILYSKNNLHSQSGIWASTIIAAGLTLNVVEFFTTGIVDYIPLDVVFGIAVLSNGDLFIILGSIIFVFDSLITMKSHKIQKQRAE